MGVVHVGAHLQPGLGLNVGGKAPGEALVVALGDYDTLIVEVADRCAEVALVRALGHAHVILLTEAAFIGGVKPVVRTEKELLAVAVSHNVTKGGVGVELAVCADQHLTGGNGIHIVAETGSRRSNHRIVCVDVSCCIVVAEAAHGRREAGVVVESLIVGLVVLAGVRDIVVVLGGAHVGAPLGLYVHLGFAELGALGGDEDDAVGAAGAVKRVGGGVLEDRHALDIVVVQRADVAGEGGAVNDDEGRVHRTVHRGETADTDCRVARAGSARGVGELKTGNSAGQGVQHIRCLCLFNCGGAHYCGCAREGRALLLAIGYGDHFVKKLGRGVEVDAHLPARGDGDFLGLETHVGKGEGLGRRRDRDGEVSVDVRYSAIALSGCHRYAHESLAQLGVVDSARHGARLRRRTQRNRNHCQK